MHVQRTSARTGLRRVVAVGALLPVLALAACGGSSSKTGASGGSSSAGGGGACAKSSGKVALSFWSWVPGIDQAAALWNKENPDIQVTVKTTPAGNAGTYQNLFNALKAKTAPDLSQVEYDSLASFRLQNGLKDISVCDVTAPAQSSFVDWTVQQTSFGEKALYAVPQDTGPMALIYRKDLFAKAGITTPPATWQEYADDAQKIKAATGANITFFPQGDANWFTGLLWQKGAQLFNTQGGANWKVDINSPDAKQVADYWQGLIAKKLVSTDLQGFSPALYKAWTDGQVASWVTAAWGYSTVRDNAKSTAGAWAVAPMPQWKAGDAKAGNWGGSTTAVLSGSAHPYEAAKFAMWLNTDPRSLAILYNVGGLYPAAKAGADLPDLKQGVPFYGGQKVFDIFKQASSQVDTKFTWGPIMTDTYRFMSDGFSKALNGQGTLTSALDSAQTQTVASLKSQSIPVAP